MDFSYEVSRSLAACEGALLVVDAAQGVEAQSVANCYTAIEQGLEVLPVLNKIDLPSAEPERVINEIEEIIGWRRRHAIRVSAKTGLGIPELLEQLMQVIPPPQGDVTAPLQALIIDSWFDPYVGVISLIRVKHGQIRPRDKMYVMSTGRVYQVDKVGVFAPKRENKQVLETGEVGFVIAGIKEIDGVPVGDTITLTDRRAEGPLPGFKELQPRVFSGLYPVSSDDYNALREALQKLKLNDSALAFRTRDLPGPGLRVSLRLSRFAAYGNRAGTPGAGIRSRSHLNRSDGHLPGREKRRRGLFMWIIRRTCQIRESSPRFGSR